MNNTSTSKVTLRLNPFKLTCPGTRFTDEKKNNTSTASKATLRLNRVVGQLTGGLPFQSIPTPEFFDYQAYRTHNHEYIRQLHEQFGDIIRIPIDGKPMVFVRNPQTVKQVLTSESDFEKTFADADGKSSGYIQYFKNLVQPLLSVSEIFGSGDNRDRRMKLKRVFMSSRKFLPGFDRVCERYMTRWPEDRVDLVPLLHELVFQMVMVIMAGEHAEGVDEMFGNAQRCLNYFIDRYTIPGFDEHINDDDEKAMRWVEDAGMDVTLAFRRRVAEEKKLDPISMASLLGAMAKFGLSDQEMNGTMINALFAACEAPIHIIAMMMVELSKKLELQETLATHLSTQEHPTQSKLLSDYVFEAMRLYAPVTLVQRQAIQNTLVDGYQVPKHTVFGVCIAAVHANEAYFPNAKEFIPQRTKMNMVVLDTANMFMPFSGGPRGCPGRHLAATIIRSSVVHMLKNFRILPSENNSQRRIHKFVEFAVDGAFVRLERR